MSVISPSFSVFRIPLWALLRGLEGDAEAMHPRGLKFGLKFGPLLLHSAFCSRCVWADEYAVVAFLDLSKIYGSYIQSKKVRHFLKKESQGTAYRQRQKLANMGAHWLSA